MQNHDIIATFKRHIQAHIQDLPSADLSNRPAPNTISIHRFSEDMKGVNAFIGTLQSALSYCKKMLSLIQGELESHNTQARNITHLKATLQNIVEEATFMGVRLFDTKLQTNLKSKTYAAFIQSPLPLLESSIADKQKLLALVAYIEEKIIEINNLLIDLSQAVEYADADTLQSSYDFHKHHSKLTQDIKQG